MVEKSAAPIVAAYARPAQVCQRYQIGKATLYRWAKTRAGFPQPVKAGEKVTLFDLAAIDAFLKKASVKG